MNWQPAEDVEIIKPDFKTYKSVTLSAKTKRGTVKIEGFYGELEPDSPTTRERLYYYKNSPES